MLNIMDSSAVRPSRTLSPSNRRFPPSMSTPRAAAIPLLLLITLLAPADDRSASGGGGVRGAVAQTDCPLVGQGIDPYSAGLVDNKPPVYVSVLLKKLIAVDGTRATASSPNISAPLPHSRVIARMAAAATRRTPRASASARRTTAGRGGSCPATERGGRLSGRRVGGAREAAEATASLVGGRGPRTNRRRRLNGAVPLSCSCRP
ncbi:unnamed protein product [Closterium sp. NIES-54]